MSEVLGANWKYPFKSGKRRRFHYSSPSSTRDRFNWKNPGKCAKDSHPRLLPQLPTILHDTISKGHVVVTNSPALQDC